MEEGLILRDIHLPEAISWWPLAPGWWILLALLLSLFFILLWTLIKKDSPKHQQSLNMLVEQELEKLQQLETDQQFIEELSAFIKRIAISRYGKKVSGYTGEKWLHFLDSRIPDNTGKPFSEGAGRALLDLPYQPSPQLDRAALIAIIKNWIMAIEEQQNV
jgi:hypothetical protein